MPLPLVSLSASFVIAGQRVKVEYNEKPLQRSGRRRTISLHALPDSPVEVSFTGDIGGSSGQVHEELLALAREHEAAPAQRLAELWARWHLNGMNAGTRAQRAAIESAPDATTYEAQVAALTAAGLNPDRNTDPARPYTYGSEWLFEPVPGAVREEIHTLMQGLDGTRYGSATATEENEAPDFEENEAPDFEDADFSNSDDTIDSRDVIKRIEYLVDFLAESGAPEAQPDDETEQPGADVQAAQDELSILRALESECSGYADDWSHGETLIRDSYFKAYAMQFAEDMGAINSDASWPNNCIDWDKAADELRQDYTAVEFDHVTYWIR